MEFSRDRLTWVAYGLLAWFAYLQAAPGLIVAHLRDELGLGYTTGGLHVAAFAAGALVAGLASGPVERALGRRALFWASAARDGARRGRADAGPRSGGDDRRAAGDRHRRRAAADHDPGAAGRPSRRAPRGRADRGQRGASVAYVVLVGALSLAAATGAGWRAALLASLARAGAGWWRNRRVAIATPAAGDADGRRRLRAAF